MTNTYNTGNPVGSTSPKDLFDNASNFDEGMNSASPSFYDRFGKRRETWSGMQKMVADFLEAMGFEATHLIYVDGTPLTVDRPTQLIERAPSVYKVKAPATFPVNLTGTWATDQLLLVDVADSSLRSSLANTADMAQGANLVGRAAYTFNSVAQMKTKEGRYDGDVCVLLGYRTTQPGWGGGLLRWNASSVSTVGLDGQRFKVTGQPTGCWERFSRGEVSIADWGVYNDSDPANIAVNNAGLQAARDYVAATLAELVFTDGGYCYTVSPNWAINRAIITTRGRVDLIYTGTGNAVILDAGATALDLCFDMRMGYFTVKVGNAAALESVYVRSVHHAKLDFNIRSAGTGKAALKVDFAVCTEFNIISSNNEEGGWYAGLAPAIGIQLCQRLVGEQVAYCYFPNAIIEHQVTGIQLEQALGNTFIGGTSEGCTHGMILFGTALRNKFLDMDFEANTTADIECSGNENEFLSCDTEKAIYIDGDLNTVRGGSHELVEIVNAGAGSNTLDGFTYNRSSLVSTNISDNGTNTRFSNLTNGASGLKHDAPPGVTSITVGASGFGFGNNRGNNIMVFVVGGTVTGITIARSGGSPNPTGEVGGSFLLTPGDIIEVSYSAAPTMYYSKL